MPAVVVVTIHIYHNTKSSPIGAAVEAVGGAGAIFSAITRIVLLFSGSKTVDDYASCPCAMKECEEVDKMKSE
jgi:hypothetical protein